MPPRHKMKGKVLSGNSESKLRWRPEVTHFSSFLDLGCPVKINKYIYIYETCKKKKNSAVNLIAWCLEKENDSWQLSLNLYITNKEKYLQILHVIVSSPSVSGLYVLRWPRPAIAANKSNAANKNKRCCK